MIDGTGPLPDPNDPYPIMLADGQVSRATVFLKPLIAQDNFEVGAYTYASDRSAPSDWAATLAPYLYPGAPGGLRIGRFCAIAEGTRFITAGANHATAGITPYPFPIFDAPQRATYQPDRRDTVIGHDVWFGHGSTVMAGAQIGHGAIIGAGAVVRGEVPAYAVVTGNPGRVHHMRFDPEAVARLLALAWWDWPADVIAAAQPALQAADIAALEALRP